MPAPDRSHPRSRARRPSALPRLGAALAVALAGLLAGLAAPARATVERFDKTPFADAADKNPCRRFGWRPVLAPPNGWHQDPAASQAQGLSVLVPDGVRLASTPVVIYVRALYAPCVSKIRSLSALIARDRAQFVGPGNGNATDSRQHALMAADGRRFPVLEFVTPGPRGPWERVAYGTETAEFYLLFTLSADSYDAYQNAVPAFENLVGRYGRVVPPGAGAGASPGAATGTSATAGPRP